MHASKTVFGAQLLCYANTIIWLFFGVTSLANLGEGRGAPVYILAIVAVLMLANAAVFGLAGYGLGRGSRLAYLLALAIVALNLPLTITDQVGLYDWITLGVDTVLLGLLLAARKEFRTG